MRQPTDMNTATQRGAISHPRFARYYERSSTNGAEARFLEPLRREVVGQARDVVLEIGAGNYGRGDGGVVSLAKPCPMCDSAAGYARSPTTRRIHEQIGDRGGPARWR